jgi:Fe-S oxidoreductase
MENASYVAEEILKKQMTQQLVSALEVCARCGICAESCHYYASEPEIKHIPAARGEALRRVYRALFDPIGRIFPKWVGASKLTEEELNAWVEMAFARCTLCERCTLNCPMGVDTAAMMQTARKILTATGKAPEILVQLVDAAIERGKNPELYCEFFLEQVAELEKELQERTGDPNAHIPVEKVGAEIMCVPLSGTHTILPAAHIMHQAGMDWTLSLFEAANYGVFLGDITRAKEVAQRIVDEAKRLKVKDIVIVECGHAYTALRWEAPKWFGGPFPFRIRSCIEMIDELIATKRIEVDPSANTEPITYHDSCNLARKGGLLEEPRRILAAVAQDFREMTPNRHENYCCGGGAGLVAVEEWRDIRLKAGRMKADQIRSTGARIVATSCDNCRLQITDLAEHYGLDVKVMSLAELVVRALVTKKGDTPHL